MSSRAPGREHYRHNRYNVICIDIYFVRGAGQHLDAVVAIQVGGGVGVPVGVAQGPAAADPHPLMVIVLVKMMIMIMMMIMMMRTWSCSPVHQ